MRKSDNLLPNGRQLKTNAHALLEITVMDQPSRRRTLIHLVNVTGHSGTAYFPPVRIEDVGIELARDFTRARAVASGSTLFVTRKGRYGRFTIPRVDAYEVVVIE